MFLSLIISITIAFTVKKSTPFHPLGLKTQDCECDSSNAPVIYPYTNFEILWDKTNVDSLLVSLNDSIIENTHSILFMDVDSLDSRLKIFKNVTKIRVIGGYEIGDSLDLSLFPKLNELHIEELNVSFKNANNWLGNLEVLYANKVKFKLKSFSELSHMKKIFISFSGFETFPKDFSSMKCLNHFTTGAHTFGEIDLTKIDIKGMKCLKYIRFHSWIYNIFGELKNVSKDISVKIERPKAKKH